MILVTGASGFVGRHVVSALSVGLRAPIRAFDVNRAQTTWPENVEVVHGAVEEPRSVRNALEGVDVVIHLAAKVAPHSRETEEMRRINVDGTASIYSAAVKSACSLFVHVSSAGVYGPPRRSEPFREDDAPMPVTPYQRTKWEAEEALRGMTPGRTTLNIVRPAGIYGPGDRAAVEEYARVATRRWVVEFAGGVIVHPTYVDDVVHAILALVESPAPQGATFNVGGERPIRLQDLRAMVAEVMGVTRRRIVMPARVAGPISMLARPVLALAGRSNPLLPAVSRGLFVSAAVDDRRFRSCYPAVPIMSLREGLRRHLEWARSEELLPAAAVG